MNAHFRKIWSTRGLEVSHRMILLAIAAEVPDGSTEAMVNRAALARQLETSTTVVGRAVAHGQRLDLVHVLRNGRIAFVTDGLPMSADVVPIRQKPAVVMMDTSSAEVKIDGHFVMTEFSNQWAVKHGQRYHFSYGKDNKLAKGVAMQMGQKAAIVSAVRLYMTSPETFYANAAHSFSVFVSVFIPRHVARVTTPEEENEYERTERKLRAQARV